MTVTEMYPYMEENAEKIEELCCKGVQLCMDAHELLLSCGGSFGYWDCLAQTGGEKHPKQIAVAIADLLAVQGKVAEALVKAREIWRLLQEKEQCAAAAT